jgi:hypothetical protein
MFTQKDKEILEGALEKLMYEVDRLSRGLDYYVDTNYGICYNFARVIRECCDDFSMGNVKVYDVVEHISHGWEKHSGYRASPIEPQEDVALWEGEQLELRIELMQYILNKLKSMSVDELNDLIF